MALSRSAALVASLSRQVCRVRSRARVPDVNKGVKGTRGHPFVTAFRKGSFVSKNVAFTDRDIRTSPMKSSGETRGKIAIRKFLAH
jgi:hypothetical protein